MGPLKQGWELRLCSYFLNAPVSLPIRMFTRLVGGDAATDCTLDAAVAQHGHLVSRLADESTLSRQRQVDEPIDQESLLTRPLSGGR